MLNPLRVL